MRRMLPPQRRRQDHAHAVSVCPVDQHRPGPAVILAERPIAIHLDGEGRDMGQQFEIYRLVVVGINPVGQESLKTTGAAQAAPAAFSEGGWVG